MIMIVKSTHHKWVLVNGQNGLWNYRQTLRKIDHASFRNVSGCKNLKFIYIKNDKF